MSQTVSVHGDLRVYDENLDAQPLRDGADLASPTGRALPVMDSAARATLLAVKAAIDAVTAALAAGIEIKDDAGGPLPVSAVAWPLPLGAATQVTLQLVLDRLGDVLAAVGNIEITADSIEINSDVLNLALDEVEDLLRAIRDRLPAALDVDLGLKVHVQNALDVVDRANRLLGHVVIDALPLPPDAATETTLANRNWRELATAILTVTDPGETLIHAPALGKLVRLWWVSAMNTREVEPIITVHLGPAGPGRKSPYHALSVAHWQRVDGPVDGPVFVELSIAGVVPVTIHFEEVEP